MFYPIVGLVALLTATLGLLAEHLMDGNLVYSAHTLSCAAMMIIISGGGSRTRDARPIAMVAIQWWLMCLLMFSNPVNVTGGYGSVFVSLLDGLLFLNNATVWWASYHTSIGTADVSESQHASHQFIVQYSHYARYVYFVVVPSRSGVGCTLSVGGEDGLSPVGGDSSA